MNHRVFRNWMDDNYEDWEKLCGVRPFPEEELPRLYTETLCEAMAYPEREALFYLFMTRYRDIWTKFLTKGEDTTYNDK